MTAFTERMIEVYKRLTTLGMEAAGTERWIEIIQQICREQNNLTIAGTNIKRSDVTPQNYVSLLEVLWKSTEPTMLFNLSDGPRYPSALAKYLWAFKPGDKVALARRVNYKLRDYSPYEKVSVKGVRLSCVDVVIIGRLDS